MLEMRPISLLDTRRGIIESLNTVENSAATEASEKNSTTRNRFEPGAANHSRQRLMILIAAKKAIHGLRGPVWSAIEPSTGDRMAMTRPGSGDAVAPGGLAACRDRWPCARRNRGRR